MIKNTAGQRVGAQMVNASDGSAFTGAVTVSVTGDAGTQATGSVGSGACTHEGNGYHTYAPAQAETNYDLIAFTFTGSGAVPVTVQVYTVAGDAFTRLGAPAGASISADIAAVKAETATILTQTDDIGVAGAGLTALGDTRLANLDATVSSRLAAASYTAPLDASGVRSAVGMAAANLDTQLATLDDFIDTEVAAILTAVDTEVGAIKAKTDNLPAAPAAVSDIPTAAQVADQVWDEDITTHLGANSTGLALNSASSAGDPWATALPGAYGTGTAGKILGDNLNATVSSRLPTSSYTAPLDAAGTRAAVGLAAANLDTQLTAIDDAIDTEVNSILAAVDTEVAAIKAKTDQLTFTTANQVDARAMAVDDKTGYAIGTGGISAAAFASGAIDSTALNANAVDEILDEQIGDGTVTMRQALKLLVATLAGKLSGAGTGTITIRNVADTTNVVVATVDGTGNRTNLTLTL